MSKYIQGYYVPINPDKYSGDTSNIIYRSSWERIAFKWLDLSKEVISWSSESIIVHYVSPIDNKNHRYYPDLWLKTIDNEFLVEIKPEKECKPPVKKGKFYNKRLKTYIINKAKWNAAELYCKFHHMKFKIITEKTLIR
jgi:hypothetical protein